MEEVFSRDVLGEIFSTLIEKKSKNSIEEQKKQAMELFLDRKKLRDFIESLEFLEKKLDLLDQENTTLR